MKSLKNILLVLVSALPLLAHARGGESGGGGAQIESAFRIRARDLISQIDHNSAANALCSSQVLLAALDNTDIRVVDKLAGATHDGSFDAWTVPGSAGKPGKMQLLKSSWDGFVNNTSATFAGHSVDILILHEVYRATQSCNDERFVLSDQIPALLGSFHNSDNFQVCTQATQKAASACSYERGTYDAISREVAQGQLPAGSDDPAHAALNNCYANLTSRCFMANSGANHVGYRRRPDRGYPCSCREGYCFYRNGFSERRRKHGGAETHRYPG